MIITELKDIIGSLKSDHAHIEECLSILKRFKQYLIRDISFPVDDYVRLLDLCTLAVEKAHYGKLNEILFPAIVETRWVQQDASKCTYFIKNPTDTLEKAKEHLQMAGHPLEVKFSDTHMTQWFQNKGPLSQILEEQACLNRMVQAMRAHAKDAAKTEMLIGDFNNLVLNQLKKETDGFLDLCDKNIPANEKSQLGQKASDLEKDLEKDFATYKVVMEELKKKHLH